MTKLSVHKARGKFTQVPLSSVSTGRYAALLDGSPETFSNVLNIQFERTRDDLDECDAAQIVTASGVPAGLVYYPNAPVKGVNVLMNELTPNAARDFADIMDAIIAVNARVIWRDEGL